MTYDNDEVHFSDCPRCGVGRFVYLPWKKHGECLECGFNHKPSINQENSMEVSGFE
ncbi:MAG: hypothetical protein N2484_04635 [Clostridia bacterium]|nr:hypothetical protein [Clostridia bacterium]